MEKETYDTWWTSKENFTEKDLASYRHPYKKHTPLINIIIHQQKKQSLVSVESGTH